MFKLSPNPLLHPPRLTFRCLSQDCSSSVVMCHHHLLASPGLWAESLFQGLCATALMPGLQRMHTPTQAQTQAPSTCQPFELSCSSQQHRVKGRTVGSTSQEAVRLGAEAGRP